MQRLTQQFSWKNLPGRTKLWIMFGIMLLLLTFLLLLIRGLYIGLSSRLIDTTSTIVEIESIPERIYTDIEMLQYYPERYLQAVYGGEAAGSIETMDELIVQIDANLSELEQLSEDYLSESESSDLGDEIASIRSNLGNISQEFLELVTLTEQQIASDTGKLALLETQGQELVLLTTMQNDAEMATNVLTLRSLESGLLTQQTEDNLQTFQVTADVYLKSFERLPEEDQVISIPEVMADYVAAAEEVSALQVQINARLEVHDLTVENIRSSLSQIKTISSDTDGSLSQQVRSSQRTINRIIILAVLFSVLGGIITLTRIHHYLSESITAMAQTLHTLEQGDYTARSEFEADDEFGQLSDSINVVASALQGLAGNLEERVAERTRDLVITTEIGRAATTAADPYNMMNDIVELIRERFGYYHAQVFLIDEENRRADLFASTGTAGRQLLLRKHSLPVGSQSVIGQVTGTGTAIIASDTSTEAVFRRNELLPDTRSEMALPMRIGDRVIGALDVQSVASNAFSEDVAAVFQIVADQLALSLDNARLQSLLSSALNQIDLIERRAVTESWNVFSQHRRPDQPISFAFARETAQENLAVSDGPIDEAIRRGSLTTQEEPDGSITLGVPIKVRGEVIGAFGFGGDTVGNLSDEDISLVEAIIDRVGLALENLRLVEETSRRAEHEQILNEITAKLVGSTDVNDILQTTVRELGRVLRAPQTSVQLRRETTGR